MLPLRAALAGSLLIVTTATAQSSSPAVKNPTSARLIGIVPGAGHMYAGEVGPGLLYLGGTAAALFVGALIGATDCLDDITFFGDPPDCSLSPAATVSFIAAGGLWVWSIFDAGRAARRTNAKRASRTALILEPTRIPAANGGDRAAVRLGLQISTW